PAPPPPRAATGRSCSVRETPAAAATAPAARCRHSTPSRASVGRRPPPRPTLQPPPPRARHAALLSTCAPPALAQRFSRPSTYLPSDGFVKPPRYRASRRRVGRVAR